MILVSVATADQSWTITFRTVVIAFAYIGTLTIPCEVELHIPDSGDDFSGGTSRQWDFVAE